MPASLITDGNWMNGNTALSSINLSENSEWLEYLELQRDKVLEITKEIEEIDIEIDDSAYSLSEGDFILHDSESINVHGLPESYFNIETFLFPKIENIMTFFDCLNHFTLKVSNRINRTSSLRGFSQVRLKRSYSVQKMD